MQQHKEPAASGTMESTTAATGDEASSLRYVLALMALSLLFLFRVSAQAIQALGDVGWLPAFESWQSGAVGYPVLLASQLLILAIQALLVFLVATGRFRPPPAVTKMLLVVGAVYFGFMLFRFLAGLTVLAGDSWFDAPLPSIFHMVLAAFLLTLSRAHTARSGNRS